MHPQCLVQHVGRVSFYASGVKCTVDVKIINRKKYIMIIITILHMILFGK